MEIFEKHKKIFLFAGIFIALFALYELFFAGGSPAPARVLTDPTTSGLVSELSASPADAIIGSELLSVLRELQSISLDASIFKNPAFVSLTDQSRPIGPQPLGKTVGRVNPFSDFGAAAPVKTTGATPR